jgi:hypothetical protein
MTTIGALLLESIAAEARRCDAGEALKFSQALACLPDRWALSEIPDAPKGPEPTPEQPHIHYTCPKAGCSWAVDWVGGSGDPEEDQRIADEVEQDIADHERKHREDAARQPVSLRTACTSSMTCIKPAADLCAADLGRIIETNGYRGRLRRIEVTEEGGYVRLLLSEQHDSDARFPVLVKLDMPVRVMPEVTA